jgi:hypothetical protein
MSLCDWSIGGAMAAWPMVKWFACTSEGVRGSLASASPRGSKTPAKTLRFMRNERARTSLTVPFSRHVCDSAVRKREGTRRWRVAATVSRHYSPVSHSWPRPPAASPRSRSKARRGCPRAHGTASRSPPPRPQAPALHRCWQGRFPDGGPPMLGVRAKAWYLHMHAEASLCSLPVHTGYAFLCWYFSISEV